VKLTQRPLVSQLRKSPYSLATGGRSHSNSRHRRRLAAEFVTPESGYLGDVDPVSCSHGDGDVGPLSDNLGDVGSLSRGSHGNIDEMLMDSEPLSLVTTRVKTELEDADETCPSDMPTVCSRNARHRSDADVLLPTSRLPPLTPSDSDVTQPSTFLQSFPAYRDVYREGQAPVVMETIVSSHGPIYMSAPNSHASFSETQVSPLSSHPNFNRETQMSAPASHTSFSETIHASQHYNRERINVTNMSTNRGILTSVNMASSLEHPLYSSLSESRLSAESRIHRCGDCGTTFASASQLRTHAMTHNPDALFRCLVCGRAFNRNANLRRHMLLHTGEHPFPCAVCGKHFRYKQSLQAHITTRHPDVPL
jgi:hypothetical protein